jgi:hypothetical protein
MPKSKIAGLGGVRDMRYREHHQRIDNDQRQHDIRSAHEAVYDHGYGVSSVKVDSILKAQSYVPVHVSTVDRT